MTALVVVSAMAGVVATPAAAAVGFGETKLTASDGLDDDDFGYSVAISVDGGTIVVGARTDSHSAVADPGSAYVYQANGVGGFDETKLTASIPTSGGLVGTSVAVSADGDTIVASGTGGIDGNGAAYVFTEDGAGGYNETKLTASAVTGVSFYGNALAIAGDVIAVGDYADDDGPGRGGSVFVYTSDGAGGYTESKLVASDAALGDLFGISVAASGDTIVVGAAGDGNSRGAAYVFNPDGLGGYDQTKLTALDRQADDRFGVSVAIDGDTIVVGADGDDEAGSAAGAIYVFTPDGDGGYDQTKLTASDGAGRDFLGESVAVSGTTVVAGASGDDDDGSVSGSTYVFTPDGAGGYDETKLTASDAESPDRFGSAVAVAGNLVVVGAEQDDSSRGSAYVYTQGPVCDGQLVTVDLGSGDVPTAGDDVILGTSGPDVIAALDGDDLVCALGGNDIVIGGPGDDIINGGGGADTIAGNAGNDTLRGDGGSDRAFGGSGTDLVEGGVGDDAALGGGSGPDRVFGGEGDDAISGGGGADLEVSGGEGDDAVNGGSGDDANVHGDAGNDTVSGNGGNDTVNGDEGADQVRGGPGDDQVFGDAGDDFVAGNAGTDTCDGGSTAEVVGDTAASNCETILNVP